MAINGTIDTKDVVKYLGVLTDSKLTWEYHIQFVVDKLRTAKGILSKLRHYASLSVLRFVYCSIAHSHLQYSITILGNAAVKNT